MEILTPEEIDKLVNNKNNEIENMNNELGKRFNYTLINSLSEEQLKLFIIAFSIGQHKEERFNKFLCNNMFYSMINKISKICEEKANME